MKIAVTAVRIEIGILVVMVTGTEPARRSLDDRHSTMKECSCSRNIRQRRWCPPHLHWTHAIAHQHYAAAIGDMAAFAAAVAIDKMRRTLQSLVWFASATSVNRRTVNGHLLSVIHDQSNQALHCVSKHARPSEWTNGIGTNPISSLSESQPKSFPLSKSSKSLSLLVVLELIESKYRWG